MSGMMAMMAGNVQQNISNGIVLNGLTLYLDAANTSSYSGSGTTWTDLSGNGNTGTIVNSPAYTSGVGGYFNFGTALNTSKRVSFTYQTPIQTTFTGFTWNIWVYPYLLDQGHVLMGYRGTTLQFYKLTTTKFEMYPAEIYHNFSATSWQYISAVYDGTLDSQTNNMKLYVNGTQVGLRDTDFPTNIPDLRTSAMPFFVGGDPDGGEYSRARISKVKVYNRALSSAEIIQNYNVHRADFGL